MSKLLIFDADSIIFTVAWKYRTKKVPNMVKMATNKFISDVLRKTNADDYLGFYAAKDEDDAANLKPNFRYSIYADYKANRPETPEFVKKWRPTIHNEFKETWGFAAVQGLEADDAVVIATEKYRNSYDEIIIATFDKDLRNIPDITYYYMKEHTIEKIDKLTAAKNFYMQMIVGDSGDHIPGLPGIGKVGAKRLLDGCSTVYSMFRVTVKAYSDMAKKIETAELGVIKEEITKINSDPNNIDDNSPYKGLSGARLSRKIRILSKQRLKDKVNEVLPGGWKAYYKQQYSLLHMLTEENEDITIQAVTKNPVKYDATQSEEDAIKAVFGERSDDDIDAFLTI